MADVNLPTFADIRTAAGRIAGHAVRTPLLANHQLDRELGFRLRIKAEPLQRTGSFKFRGAYNRIAQIDPKQTPGGVVAYSSGNHAQGVAAAAALRGLPAVIVMPEDSPRIKMRNVEGFGARIVTFNRDTEDREAIARAIAAENGAVIVPPYDDPDIIAGQGTVGLEIAEQAKEAGLAVDHVIAPASGGGLIAGIALATAELMPNAKVWCAEPAGFDDHARSLARGERVANAATSGSICDALLARQPGELTFAINRSLLAGGHAATDAETQAAIAFAFEHFKLVAEPGGAVALAAVIKRRLEPEPDTTVVVVVSGGNVDRAGYCAALAA